MSPDCPLAHNALGVALELEGDYQAALACFRKAVRRQPDYVEAHNNLGAALKELGDIEGAIRSMDEAIRLKSGMAHGECEQLHDRAKQAAVRPTAAGELSLAALHYNRAMMLLLAGDCDRGVARVRMAVAVALQQAASLELAAMGWFAARWSHHSLASGARTGRCFSVRSLRAAGQAARRPRHSALFAKSGRAAGHVHGNRRDSAIRTKPCRRSTSTRR